MLTIYRYPQKSEWESLLQRPYIDDSEIEQNVSKILQTVKQDKDKALFDFTSQFDGIILESFIVSVKEFEEAEQQCDKALKEAILLAKANIEKFHQTQITDYPKVEIGEGVVCWRENRAIEKVGLYIPGGSAPLFSTILMLGVPAKIAGCKEIVLCTPPNKNGKIHHAILFTAKLLGINSVFKVGGAQAIAAMAYGTETVPRVDKIFGPGNQYVTVAKQLISKNGIAIDMPAGPSEQLVIADETCVPAFVAADLLSQAEHGPDSQVILVSTELKVIEAVNKAISEQIERLPRKTIALKALENSKAFLVKDITEAIDLSNAYAPEHLIIATQAPEMVAEQVINAGSIFIGNYACESAGDYASGTNHTLPTNGFARAYSGVSVDSFVKKVTFQKLTAKGLSLIGPAIATMAAAEGLEAHRNAVNIRLQSIEK